MFYAIWGSPKSGYYYLFIFFKLYKIVMESCHWTIGLGLKLVLWLLVTIFKKWSFISLCETTVQELFIFTVNNIEDCYLSGRYFPNIGHCSRHWRFRLKERNKTFALASWYAKFWDENTINATEMYGRQSSCSIIHLFTKYVSLLCFTHSSRHS